MGRFSSRLPSRFATTSSPPGARALWRRRRNRSTSSKWIEPEAENRIHRTSLPGWRRPAPGAPRLHLGQASHGSFTARHHAHRRIKRQLASPPGPTQSASSVVSGPAPQPWVQDAFAAQIAQPDTEALHRGRLLRLKGQRIILFSQIFENRHAGFMQSRMWRDRHGRTSENAAWRPMQRWAPRQGLTGHWPAAPRQWARFFAVTNLLNRQVHANTVQASLTADCPRW